MFRENAASTAKVVALEPRSRARPGPAGERDSYRVSLSRSSDAGWTLRVVDRLSGRNVLDWQGAVLRGLPDKHPVLATCHAGSSLHRSKEFVRRLVTTKAAMELGRASEGGRQTARFSKPDLSDACVVALLRSRPGVHYTLDDATCLLALEGYCVSTDAIEKTLGRLCDRGQLQRIVAAPGRLFYDCDPRPHLHIYDPVADELHDAPTVGVIERPARMV